MDLLSIVDLPNELQLLVLDQFNSQEVILLSQTCSYYNKLVRYGANTVWYKLYWKYSIRSVLLDGSMYKHKEACISWCQCIYNNVYSQVGQTIELELNQIKKMDNLLTNDYYVEKYLHKYLRVMPYVCKCAKHWSFYTHNNIINKLLQIMYLYYNSKHNYQSKYLQLITKGDFCITKMHISSALHISAIRVEYKKNTTTNIATTITKYEKIYNMKRLETNVTINIDNIYMHDMQVDVYIYEEAYHYPYCEEDFQYYSGISTISYVEATGDLPEYNILINYNEWNFKSNSYVVKEGSIYNFINNKAQATLHDTIKAHDINNGYPLYDKPKKYDLDITMEGHIY